MNNSKKAPPRKSGEMLLRVVLLNGVLSLDKADEEHDDRHDKENMYEPAHRVARDYAEKPEHE
jgi:hypothetical protein